MNLLAADDAPIGRLQSLRMDTVVPVPVAEALAFRQGALACLLAAAPGRDRISPDSP